MPEKAPRTPPAADADRATDEIPRALVTGADYAFLLDGLLGLVAVALGVWYGLRRPTVAVLAVAVLLAGYVLFHLWQRYQEHPDHGRRFRRKRTARGDS